MTRAPSRAASAIKSPATADLAQALADARIVGAKALQVVVEMRQVDQRQRWRTAAADMQGGFRDPARRCDRRRRPPEIEQRKRPEPCGQLIAQFERLAVAVRQLAPVGTVDRPRRDADVMGRRHVVPPEQIGGGERGIAPPARLPDLFAGDETVRLPPQPHLHEVAEQPAVGDDTVLARQRAGHEGGLYRASDRRRHGRERPQRAGSRQRADMRRVRADVARGEPGHQDDERWAHESRRLHGRNACEYTRLTSGNHKSTIGAHQAVATMSGELRQ